jgi:hypothetical protein
MTASLVYKFLSEDDCEIFIDKMKSIPLTKDDLKAARLRDVMHFWVYEAAMRSKSSASASENELLFVRDGMAAVRIATLPGKAPAMTRRIGMIGASVVSAKSDLIYAMVPVGKLNVLAELSEVKYIAPHF